MSVRITCIKKDNDNPENPHLSIKSFNWINEQSGVTGESTLPVMYDWVVNKGGKAYIRNSQGILIYLFGALTPSGTPYLRAVHDKKWTDDLIKLEECK